MDIIHKIQMKEGFGKALVELGNENKEIFCLGADITGSVGMDKFRDAFPKRFISLGIAEQNIVGVAAGLALSGKIPFLSSYAVFSALRATDQIRVSVCYNNIPVKIGGAHAGISVGPDGATHQALEDIAVMRSLPNMTVLSPCDSTQTFQATIASVEQVKAACYIRYFREALPNFTNPKEEFIVGKAQVLKDGKDVGIIATGSMVWQALMAHEVLKNHGISSRILNIHTLKPIDKEEIIKTAKKCSAIISVEEHQIYGGLGSAVAEVLAENYPAKMKIIGMPDCFGESGKPDELLEIYGLNYKRIVDEAIKLTENK
jgi:transketolase